MGDLPGPCFEGVPHEVIFPYPELTEADRNRVNDSVAAVRRFAKSQHRRGGHRPRGEYPRERH